MLRCAYCLGGLAHLRHRVGESTEEEQAGVIKHYAKRNITVCVHMVGKAAYLYVAGEPGGGVCSQEYNN